MDNIKIGFVVAVAVLLATIAIYLTRFGGEHYIFLTDLLAVIYSLSAVVIGIYVVRIYSLKSLQGKALFLIVIGITSWFLAEFIWLLFFRTVAYYSEFLRFLGYAPLIVAFFFVLHISDPEFRIHRRRIIPLFIIFLVFSIIYLNLVPVIFGGVSLLASFLTSGYVVADFVLLFGIFLLVKASLAFKKGSMSFGWLIIAIAFISTFIFDVYFAFYHQLYLFGDLIELFWLANYILLAYGFFYHNQIMKNFLKFDLGGKEKQKKNRKPLIITIIAVFTTLLSIYLLLSLIIISPSQKPVYIVKYKNFTDFAIEYRDDISVIFAKDVSSVLNNEYNTSIEEYLFCLIGNKTNNEIYINSLARPELFYQGEEIVISKVDPACQIENSLGSIHSHLTGSCRPSPNDIFSWGEMKNPEPIINAVQCNVDTFYIMLMPGEHEALDFSSLRWSIAG